MQRDMSGGEMTKQRPEGWLLFCGHCENTKNFFFFLINTNIMNHEL